MKFRTRSILQLTIIGFLIVVALLGAALLVTGRQLELLTELSQRTATQSATAMRASRQLLENTSSMERNARQYAITSDTALLQYYDAEATATATTDMPKPSPVTNPATQRPTIAPITAPGSDRAIDPPTGPSS